MKPIKATDNNVGKIEELLASINGAAKAHTMSVDDVLGAATDFGEQMDGLSVPAKCRGSVIVIGTVLQCRASGVFLVGVTKFETFPVRRPYYGRGYRHFDQLLLTRTAAEHARAAFASKFVVLADSEVAG